MKMNVARMLLLLSISGLPVESQNPIRRQMGPQWKKSTGNHHQDKHNCKCDHEMKQLSNKGVNDFNEHMSSFFYSIGWMAQMHSRDSFATIWDSFVCAGHIV